MFKKIILGVFLLISTILCAQNDTSSPYSLYGLGVENKTSFGGFTAMGNTGVAQITPFQINNFNPANLANIPLNTFLYEVGINGIYATLKTEEISQTTNDFNFSHLTIAFPVVKNWGMSIGLMPFSKVGYNIDVENSIEGSLDTFTTSINGSGGLNNFYWGNGYRLTKNLSLGLELSFLFGTIEEESWVLTTPSVNIIDNNYYNGFKFKTGLHFTLPTIGGVKTTIGSSIELPTKLNGTQTRSSFKTNADYKITVEEETENELDSFELPLSINLGFSSKLNKTLITNFDIKKLWWENTNHHNNTENYANQSIYAMGIEYKPSKNYGFLNILKYRVGFNYNTGFLNISNQKIDSYNFSVGVGLPISKKKTSTLNISYSYGKEGTVSNNLIQENFHKLTLNLSLIGNWFQKLKIY